MHSFTENIFETDNRTEIKCFSGFFWEISDITGASSEKTASIFFKNGPR